MFHVQLPAKLEGWRNTLRQPQETGSDRSPPNPGGNDRTPRARGLKQRRSPFPLHLALSAAIATNALGGVDLQVLIPLYSYPSWYQPSSYIWDDVGRAGSRVPTTAIINPDNGPGPGFPNSDYSHGMADLASAGVKIVGYVYTSYGARDLATVKSDIDQYTNSPLVTGIFLDEAASATNQLAYYQDLYAYIHARTNFMTVILNPGTQTTPEYLTQSAADTAVIFESGTGWREYVPDPYVSSLPANHFAALAYDCGSAEAMRTNVDLAVHRNIGWVYVTTGNLPNPWDALPPYWDNLVDYVAAYRELRATSITATNGNLSITFSAIPNRPAHVEWAPNLPSTNWTPATGTLVPTGTVLTVLADTNLAAAKRFYRLRLSPP